MFQAAGFNVITVSLSYPWDSCVYERPEQEPLKPKSKRLEFYKRRETDLRCTSKSPIPTQALRLAARLRRLRRRSFLVFLSGLGGVSGSQGRYIISGGYEPRP